MQPVPQVDSNQFGKRAPLIKCRAAEAIAIIDEQTSQLGRERIPTVAAAGRILASPAVAVSSVPGFRRAAMDGYAIASGDVDRATATHDIPHAFTIVGESLPGRPYLGAVQAGECVAIATGAVVPDATDTIVRWENVERQEQQIVLRGSIEARRDVALPDEDIPEGTVLIRPPRVMRPQDVAACLSCGIAEVEVIRKPRVGVFSIGDELLPAGAARPYGLIVDTNSLVLSRLVQRDGGELIGSEPELSCILPDDFQSIREAVARMAGRVDCLLVSGSTSHGRGDCMAAVLADLGETFFRGIRIRPAGPLAFGMIHATPIVLLPGNPIACLFGYEMFARRILQLQQGRKPDSPFRTQKARLCRRVASAAGRIDFVRVRFTHEGEAEPVWPRGASVLSSAVVADGFVVVPEPIAGYEAGEQVEVHLFDDCGPPVLSGD
jgi:molybdopterin molybdotransferase